MNPNPGIENTMLVQVLDAPRKREKTLITNEVNTFFSSFLCTSITCTIKRISISGFGMKIILMLLLFVNCASAAKLKDPLQAGWKEKKVCEQLSENDHERVLRCTFPPGVGHEKHQHNAHFGYALSGGKMQLTDDKGTRVVELATNSYFESQGKKWHQVLNVGDSTVIYLMIESKTPNTN